MFVSVALTLKISSLSDMHMVETELTDSKVPRGIHKQLNEKHETFAPTGENKRHLFDCFYLLSISSCFENLIPDKTILLLRIVNLANRNRKIEWA